MSGHFRFGSAAFLLFAGFATPAASNPFTDLFSPNTAPEAVTAAPAAPPTQEECLPQPGKSTAPGQHWVYRHDGHRKCWFQADTASTRKPALRHVARQRAAPQENEPASGKQKGVVEDAHAEMMSSAPTEAPQPASRAPDIQLVDATPISATSAATLVPGAPVVGNAASDPVPPERSTPPQLNEETLLAAAPAVPDAIDTFAISVAPIAVSTLEASEDGRWSWASWLGLGSTDAGRPG